MTPGLLTQNSEEMKIQIRYIKRYFTSLWSPSLRRCGHTYILLDTTKVMYDKKNIQFNKFRIRHCHQVIQNKDNQLNQSTQVHIRAWKKCLRDFASTKLEHPRKIAWKIKYDATFPLLQIHDLHRIFWNKVVSRYKRNEEIHLELKLKSNMHMQ